MLFSRLKREHGVIDIANPQTITRRASFIAPAINLEDRNNRGAAPAAVFAGVKSFAAQRVDVHGDYGVVSSAVAGASDAPATCCKTWRSIIGSSFPRFSARRKIPRQAFAVKQYRRRWSPISKVSDNDNTPPPLGHSVELSVKNAVGEPIPEFPQAPEEGTKGASFVDRQNAGDIFPNHPLRAKPVNKAQKFEGEISPLSSKAFSKAGDAEILAWGSANKNIDWFIVALFDSGEVAVDGNARPAMFQDIAAWCFDFGKESRTPAERMPCDRRGFDSGTY